MPRFTGHTDVEEEFRLDSLIVDAFWNQPEAYVQGAATLDVRTLYVASGSPVSVHIVHRDGTPLDKVKGTVEGGIFRKRLPVKPAWAGGVFFEIDLPEHGLKATGPTLPVPGTMRLHKPEWKESATGRPVTRLRRGMDVDASARVEGVPEGTEGVFHFQERLADRQVRRIASIPCRVEKGRLSLTWRFDYPRETALLSSRDERRRTVEEYHAPRIGFEVECRGARARGDQAGFVDWLRVEILDALGRPLPGQRLKALLADGSVQEVVSDARGIAHLEDIAPGNTRLELLDPPVAKAPAAKAPGGPGVGPGAAPAVEAAPEGVPEAPAPVPPPVALATPPRVRGPIRLWVNAFIPDEIKGYTRRARGGFEGMTAIPIPWQLGREGFLLTDGRAFSHGSAPKSRFKTFVSLDFEGSLPIIAEQFAYCDPLQLLDGLDAEESTRGKPEAGSIRWHGLTGTTDLITISLDARAKLPLLGDLPDILFQGSFTLDLKAMTLGFSGRCSAFPAFEAYARVRKGPVNEVVQAPPAPGASPWDLMEGAKRYLEIGAREISA